MIELTLAELERFWAKVNKTDSCWLWTASTRMGYGAFKLRGTVFDSHRLIWLMANGPLDDGYEVCHKCNNRLCVRLDHLYAGTRSDNMQDSLKAGTFRTGRLSDEQVKQIRELNLKGIGTRKLSQYFPVSRTEVQKLVQGKTYKHVD